MQPSNVDQIAIRRAIMRLSIGQTVKLPTPPGTEEAAAKSARAFGRAKAQPIVATTEPGYVLIERVETLQRPSLYPELDALKIGESHLFPYPPQFHQRVRMAATLRNKSGKVRLACNLDGDYIRVTRLPLKQDESEITPSFCAQKRPTKYDLDRLSTQREIRFELPPADHHKLRLACSQKARITGWAIRCRLQDDGSMLVYRTDTQTTAAE